MALLPEARMVVDASGTWKLVVLTGYEPLEWPAYDFGRIAPLPSVAERVAVLAALGFTAREGAAWEWDVTATPRRIVYAKVPVRPVAEHAAVPVSGGAV
ncbi:hypothetical protein G3I27_23890 [Streptomyces sp. SID10692]|uniref:DUF6303 family protein n=1 Tax=Streptomyces sp. SID10692 TaxID=2706026 RepID=UPI0013D912AB|nr:hypothetical protein [Streptomyces sp. SID10692]